MHSATYFTCINLVKPYKKLMKQGLFVSSRSLQEKDWNQAGPCGAPGHKSRKPFCVSHFLITGNRLHSASWPSLNSKGQVQTAVNQGREGKWRQGRNSQETIVQPWGGVLVPPQGIYITISLSCFADTVTPTRWEKLTVCCPQTHRPQSSWNWKVDDAGS